MQYSRWLDKRETKQEELEEFLSSRKGNSSLAGATAPSAPQHLHNTMGNLAPALQHLQKEARRSTAVPLSGQDTSQHVLKAPKNLAPPGGGITPPQHRQPATQNQAPRSDGLLPKATRRTAPMAGGPEATRRTAAEGPEASRRTASPAGGQAGSKRTRRQATLLPGTEQTKDNAD